jgi:hypothetical protein
MNIKREGIIFFTVASVLVIFLTIVLYGIERGEQIHQVSAGYYESLPNNAPDTDPLLGISEDFVTEPSVYVSNLPLVVIHLDGDLPEYKHFENGNEVVDTDVDPWIGGSVELFDNDSGLNMLTDDPVLTSIINIKKRGHTSISFDKSQYYIKLVNEDGTDRDEDVFGMGADDSWILNGSLADKSMLRNYLAYRVSAQIMEYAPRCCFCEMFTVENGIYTYQGVYLMQESIKRSENRVRIDESKRGEVYTSYLIRRDRYTNFDTMLDTYARLEGLSEEWIGVKYPNNERQSKDNLSYIQDDYSRIERILLSENPNIMRSYPRYLDADTFVDYFLINEYFGNYDAGEHSTYMYKNSGEKLKIGPVWDFDQAMNNSVVGETDPYVMAMQDRALFVNLVADTEFIDQLKKRYSDLRESYLNDDYVFGIIDEAENYLQAARQREWFRWAENYYDSSYSHAGSYYLNDYTKEGVVISRYNDNYDQEIYNLKTYLSIHGRSIQPELTILRGECTVTSGFKGEMTLMLIITCALFAVPSILINRK